MKIGIFIFSFFIISIQVFGQKKNINVPINNKGDTSYYFKSSIELNKKLHLTDLKNSPNDFYFRVWYIGSVVYTAIDVFKVSDSNFKAIVTFYTKEYINHPEEKPTGRIFNKSFEIDSSNSFKVYQFINSRNINSIPSEEYIKGWSLGLDGEVYIFERLDKNNYSLKSYWTPSAQDSLKEAKEIESFNKDLYSMLNVNKLRTIFYKDIPFECYGGDGSRVGIRALTKQEERKYKKERDQYRKLNNIEN